VAEFLETIDQITRTQFSRSFHRYAVEVIHLAWIDRDPHRDMSFDRQSRLPDGVDLDRKITAGLVVSLEPPGNISQPPFGVRKPEQIKNLPTQSLPAVDRRPDKIDVAEKVLLPLVNDDLHVD
jgi:hypothetical protein